MATRLYHPDDSSPEAKAERRKTKVQRQIEAQERRRRALDLRRAGLTYEVVGQQLGVSQERAVFLVQDALKKIPYESAHQLRQLEVLRTDRVLAALDQRVRSGDEKAVNAWVRVMDYRAKLCGLYQDAGKVEATTPQPAHDQGDAKHELHSRITSILERRRPQEATG